MAQVHFLSSKKKKELVVYLEQAICFRVLVHFSELMLFSGLLASLIFHPSAEWKRDPCSQDRAGQREQSAAPANLSGDLKKKGDELEAQGRRDNNAEKPHRRKVARPF